MYSQSPNLPVTLPAGAIVKVVKREAAFVEIEWDELRVFMFAVDLDQRAELIRRETATSTCCCFAPETTLSLPRRHQKQQQRELLAPAAFRHAAARFQARQAGLGPAVRRLAVPCASTFRGGA